MLRDRSLSSLLVLASLVAVLPLTLSCEDQARWVRVRGRVLSANGSPAVGSEVTLVYSSWTPSEYHYHGETKVADGLGSYEFGFAISAVDSGPSIEFTAKSAKDESSIYGKYDLIDDDVVIPDLSFWNGGVVVATDDEGRSSLTWSDAPDDELPCYGVRLNSIDATSPFDHNAWAAGPMQLPTYLLPVELAEDNAFKAYVFTTYGCSEGTSIPDTHYVAAPVVVPPGFLVAPSRGDSCFIATESGNVLLTGARGVCPLTDGEFTPVFLDDCVDATCGQQGPHDVLIDLGGQTAVHTIVVRGLRTAGGGPTFIDIELSSDGEAFDLVGTAADIHGEGFVLEELAPPSTGRWVRVRVADLPIWQLSEIAIF